MDLSNVEQMINAFYQQGAVLATAIDVEGQQTLGRHSREAPCQRKFLLFFEEAVENKVYHVAYITLGSRVHAPWSYNQCCTRPNDLYDTDVIRRTWADAGARGWRVAESFDTGREKASGSQGHHLGGPRFKDSMVVYDAPVSGIQAGQTWGHAGLVNMGNLPGGFGMMDPTFSGVGSQYGSYNPNASYYGAPGHLPPPPTGGPPPPTGVPYTGASTAPLPGGAPYVAQPVYPPPSTGYPPPMTAPAVQHTSTAPLPAGWAEYTEANGRTYYHNAATGITQYERPPDPMIDKMDSVYLSFPSDGRA